jgi:two-component system, NtrC family, nitrogen regulation response regulator NtrX
MKKILFADDEKELHPIIQDYFPKEKFRVVHAYDGLEGLQKCRNEEFDLIILDFKMPKMDGSKLYQQIRDLQDSKKSEMTPVIFVTESLEELMAKDIKWARCEFLSKPFSNEELLQKIQKLKDEKPKVSATKADNKIILNPGEYLCREGDALNSIYYVVNGILDTFKRSPDGKDIMVGKVGAGELVGEMAILNSEKSLLSIVAVERCEIIVIPSEKVLSVVNGQPKWIKIMLENMSKRLSDTLKQIA